MIWINNRQEKHSSYQHNCGKTIDIKGENKLIKTIVENKMN